MNVSQDFVMRHIYGKHILMPVRKNNVSSDPILLNDVAAYIWETVSKQPNRDKILEEITEHFNLKIDPAERLAVENFLNHMISMKLVEESEKCNYG